MRLFVRPEVSTIDLANAVTFSGFRIPALATRRMETNIELSPGQSFVIGGLIDDRVTESMTRIPGLSSIPVLGALFKSRSEQKSKTELIVMVTPEVVEPLNATDPKPVPVWPSEFLGPYVKPASSTKSRNKGGTMRANSKTKDGQPVAPANGAPQETQNYVVKLDDLIPPGVEPPASTNADPAPAPAELNGPVHEAPVPETGPQEKTATASTVPVDALPPAGGAEPPLPEAVKPERSQDAPAPPSTSPETPPPAARDEAPAAKENGAPVAPETTELPTKPAPAPPSGAQP
jgi:hypothetical protein